MKDRFYLLKICLLDIEPVIWRRFVVPAYLTLDRLHDVIQIVMGWDNCHLYEFIVGGSRYDETGESGEEAGEYSIGELLKRKGQKMLYIYDFGDEWRHEIVLENSAYAQPEDRLPIICVDGERTCPPEDVHGPWGYAEFCEAMTKGCGRKYADYLDWYGDDFDSEHFDKKLVDWKLTKYIYSTNE
ncbi:MAG: plasmid pRiA4b ORF-3 family protein [Phycisphaerae bacterium]